MHPDIFQAALDHHAEIRRESERAARRQPDFPAARPLSPAADLSSLRTLAAVAAWMRRPNTTTTCEYCQGGD